MDFTETIVVYDVKVSICSKLNEYMDLNEYQRSRSLIDLGPRSLRFNIFKLFSLETARPVEAKFHVEHPRDGITKGYSNGLDHMTSMAATPIYSKNLNQRTIGPVSPEC